jgi:hypothetical protein
MKAIYYPRGNLIDIVFRSEASPVWHGIEHGLKLFKKELFGESEMEKILEYGQTIGYLETLLKSATRQIK